MVDPFPTTRTGAKKFSPPLTTTHAGHQQLDNDAPQRLRACNYGRGAESSSGSHDDGEFTASPVYADARSYSSQISPVAHLQPYEYRQ